MNFTKHFCTTLMLMLSFSAFGQSVISGKVIDEALGEGLISAYVYIESLDKTAATDFDGKYTLEVAPGTYTLKVSYIGYTDKVIEDVVVGVDETKYVDILMSEATEMIEEVVVKAKAITRSENAVLMLQKKSYKIQDGISSQEMAKLSVGSVASAMKKITGATVQDGKYLNVRGLGDRYSLAQLDGIQLPSVDPYKNSAQLDFIPTNIIDNIIASKTFTPDQPGTFTGGNVTIKTKTFPERETFSAGVSFGYNTESSFNKDFLKSKRAKYDYLGYDDGSRKLNPAFLDKNNQEFMNNLVYLKAKLGHPGIAEGADKMNKLVNYDFVADRKTSPLNHGVGFSYGNAYNFGDEASPQQIGLILSLKYGRSYTHKDQQTRASYGINGGLRKFGDYRVDNSVETPSINGFVGIAYRPNSNHEISLKNIYNHQTAIGSRYVKGEDGQNIQRPSFKLGRDNTFQQLDLNLTSLAGRHNLGQLEVNWVGSVIQSSRYEPELAYLSSQYNEETGKEGIPAANVAPPLLYWRDIADQSYSGKVDLKYNIPSAWKLELKTGGLYSHKDRNSDEFALNVDSSPDAPQYNGKNIREFFDVKNAGIIGNYENGNSKIGNFLINYTNPKNSYKGNTGVTAAYVMLAGKPSDYVRFVTGLRAEYTTIFAQSKIVQTIDVVKPDDTNTGEIKSLDYLPSASIIVNPNDNSNIRVSYARTIARPGLREIAPFASWDPILSIFYLGNPKITTTNIDNYDLRWELFMQPGEILAVSAFYKDFTNPISLSVKPASNTEFQYVNVESGQVSGIEMEFRKNLVALSPALEGLKFGGNFAIIRSKMDIPENARFKPAKRTFVGQSPFLANANLTYSFPNSSLETTVSYNYIGRRLASLGDQAPDTYADPFNTLNAVVSFKLGVVDIKLGALNLLNNNVRQSLIFEKETYITSDYKKGRTFNVGLSYKY